MATSVELIEDLEAWIARLSGHRRSSPKMIVDEAVQQYVEREEASENFKQEAEASRSKYQATGLHLMGHEARA